MIDYSKITEEVEQSEFNLVSKIINNDIELRFYLDYEYIMYSTDGKPQLKVLILKKFNKGVFHVSMGISQELMNDVNMDLDKFFTDQLYTQYKRRDKTKDPK